MEASLRGRDAELRTLRASLDAAFAGRGGVALVTGEPGIGKSALVGAIAREAEARGAAVTWGRAWEFADAPPYFPLWPCLRTLGVDAEREDAQSFRMWERVAGALAASKATVVCILEDLHAADLGTLDLLTFLAQPIRAMRVFVVATIRMPDPRITDRMLQRINRMARDGIDVRLPPLSATDVAAVTKDALGRAVGAKELGRLVELTGGNPLFVVECARMFRAAGGVEGTLGSLPPTVRQVVLDRVAALPEATRDALACGAVLGREFAAKTVAAMRGTLPARVIDTLLVALRAGIVGEPKPAHFVFSHAIVRDAVEDALEPDERAELHARADAALASAGETADVLVERARHALSALRRGGEEHALGLATRALALLERDEAFDRAFDLCARIDAARAAGFLPQATAAERLDAAVIARAAGRSEVSRRICEAVLAGARDAGDAEALARAALLHAADIRPVVLDRTQASYLEEARDALGDTRPALLCRVLVRLAAALMPARDPSVPIGIARDAIALARTTGDASALVDVLELAGWGLYYAPLDERIAVATELRDLALARGDLQKALPGHAMLTRCHLERGDFDAFAEEVESMLALSEALGHPRHRWRPLLLASMRAVALGHFAESERYVTEVTELAAMIDDPALPTALALHGLLRARAQRNDDEARARLATIEDALRGSIELPANAALMRAACYARMEDVEGTRAALAGIGSRATMLFSDLAPNAFYGEACALAGTEEQRRSIRDVLCEVRATDLSADVFSFTYEGTVGRVIGLLDASLGDLESAERRLRDAYALAQKRGHLPWQAQIGYELANVLRRTGKERESKDLEGEAFRLARELGMPGLARSSSTGAPPAARPAPFAVSVQKTGADYTVRGGAITVTTRDSRGMQLLARLVERPNEEIHVLALASDEPVASLAESSAGDVIDDSAKRAYRRRLADLESDLAEAEAHADRGRIAKLRGEKEALLAELQRAVGLGGRARQAGSATERARVNVQRRIKDAIARIAEADAELGRFFERTVRTGTFCCFRPE